MTAENNPNQNHVFPLILTEKLRVLYKSDRRLIYVNGQKKVAALSQGLDLIFMQLLRHPNEVQSYLCFYNLFYPDDKLGTPLLRSEAQEIIRPRLSHLRSRLKKANEKLPDLIETISKEGIVYKPHQSLEVLKGEFPIDFNTA